MKRKNTYLFIYLFIYLFNYGQVNLVPNPSFEDTISDNCWAQMGIANPTIGPYYFTKNWGTYQFQSPDFYNVCANSSTVFAYPNPSSIPHHCRGYQFPHFGNSFIGIGLYGLSFLPDSTRIETELAVVQLKQVLKANTCYYGEFYMNFSNINAISINQLGMLFTKTDLTASPFVVDNISPYQIQWDTTTYFTDTLNWVKVSGKFIAQGGEQYLTIGNIRDGAHLKKQFVSTTFTTPCGISNPHRIVYAYIDDVALYELPSPQLGALNYTICNNSDSLVLGDTARLQTNYQWFANGLPISTSNTIIVKPTQTTNYVLQSKQCGVTNQTITVTYSTNCEPVVVTEPIIPNVFTPNNDNVNDTFEFTVSGATNLQFTVYNRWGLEISNDKSEIKNKVIWSGYTTSGEPCNAGIYFYVLTYKDANGDEHKKNGYISLIK